MRPDTSFRKNGRLAHQTPLFKCRAEDKYRERSENIGVNRDHRPFSKHASIHRLRDLCNQDRRADSKYRIIASVRGQMKVALITGVTGQDGSYLAEFLLKKGYHVWGMIRRSSSFNTSRIDHLIESRVPNRFRWERGDLTDESSLIKVLNKIAPDEIYNLGAQTHVMVSFEMPVYTAEVAFIGTLQLLEAVKNLNQKPRMYQASSSEMFGSSPPPQNEGTAFNPQSPYAIAKVAAHQTCLNYRDGLGLWVACGILFNHESPRRGETFVSRKITRAVSRMAFGLQKKLVLGDLDRRRDWGFAPEYVEMMWKILQQRNPGVYVLATGEAHSVREFVDESFLQIGVTLEWKGSGLQEEAVVDRIANSNYKKRMSIRAGDTVVVTSKDFMRPTDPEILLGDSSKAKKQLGWKPTVKFQELVKIMTDADLKRTLLLLEGTEKHREEWREFLV